MPLAGADLRLLLENRATGSEIPARMALFKPGANNSLRKLLENVVG
jgi:hypothetical protein